MRTSRHRILRVVTAALLTSLPALAARPVPIVGTPANQIAEDVLHNLLSTPMGKATPPCSWSVTLVQGTRVNAYVDGNGHITVAGGMVAVFGNERGLWAAVLGHEIGHFVVHRELQAYLPRFQAALDQAYATALGHDGSAPRLVPIGRGMGRQKLAREREFEADRVGLMLMAEAGYHPDYVILLERMLHAFYGDEPKLTEVFSSHPRWAGREERTREDREVAEAIFRSHWPDAAKSPGGPPPPFGSIGAIEVEQDGNGSMTLQVPVRISNVAGRQVRVEAVFLDKDRRVTTPLPQYRSTDGLDSLVLNTNLAAPPAGEQKVTLNMPAGALPPGEKKLKAMVFLLAGDRLVDLATKRIEVAGAR